MRLRLLGTEEVMREDVLMNVSAAWTLWETRSQHSMRNTAMSKIEEYIEWIDACAEYQLQEMGDERGYANFLTVAALLRAGQKAADDSLAEYGPELYKTLCPGAYAFHEALKDA